MSETLKDKNCKIYKNASLKKISLFFSNTHSFYIREFICMITKFFTPAKQFALIMLISSLVIAPLISVINWKCWYFRANVSLEKRKELMVAWSDEHGE
jgi:hypothetical protein